MIRNLVRFLIKKEITSSNDAKYPTSSVSEISKSFIKELKKTSKVE